MQKRTYEQICKEYGLAINTDAESELFKELTKKKKEIALKVIKIYESEGLTIRDMISINRIVSKMTEHSKIDTNGFYEYFDHSEIFSGTEGI